MDRITGTLAVLAGVFLLLPGVFAVMHGTSGEVAAPLPGWMIRDLIFSSLAGTALMFWGAGIIRQRELELHEIPVRYRLRRR